MPITPTGFNAIMNLLALMLLLTLERDLPTALQDQWKTYDDDKSISFMTLVDHLFCPYPRSKLPYKNYKCPAHPHLHSTLDQSYHIYLTTSFQDIYSCAKLMHMEKIIVCSESSKPYFVWQTQQLVVVDTTFFDARSPYCTHQGSD